VSFVPRVVAVPAQDLQRPRLLWPLVEESLSEAEFLWNRFDNALDAHDHSLADAQIWAEDRLQGALDGVRVAGAEAIEPLLRSAVQAFEPPLVSVAAYLLACLPDRAAHELLEASLRELTPYHARAFALGLGRSGRAQLLRNLWTRTSDAPGLSRGVLLDALTFCGAAPQTDFMTLLEEDCAELRAAAASALRFVPQAEVQPLFERAFESSDAALRTRAIAAGVLRGNASCWWRCVEQVEEPDGESGPLLLLAATLGAASEVECVVAAQAMPELARDALWALGFAGTSAAMEACFAALREGRHEQVAAEALAASGGLDLHKAKLVRPVDEAEDPEAEVRLPGPDDRLPLPDVAGVEAWWTRERARFAPGVRYLGGRPLTRARLNHALMHGPTRRRHALALELSARSAGLCALETCAFTRAQHEQMRALAVLAPETQRDSAHALGIPPLSEA
jgi:uncharacterized protein (TIGR02270 family)